jgi:hypothetical protein
VKPTLELGFDYKQLNWYGDDKNQDPFPQASRRDVAYSTKAP